MRLIYSLCGLLFSVSAVAAQCPQAEQDRGLVYRVDSGQKVKTVTLFSEGDQVLYINGNQPGEIWNRQRNGKQHLVRFFDNDQRAIEYDDSEIENGSEALQQIRALVTPEGLQQAELVATVGEGCQRADIYLQQGLKSSWMARVRQSDQVLQELKLMKPYSVVRWKLDREVSDAQSIRAEFARREAYQATDYADIGDNEADPFLAKYINLGYVGHASGAFDAQGNAFKGNHGHAH